MDDFEIIGKIVVDEQGKVAIQGLNDELDRTASTTSSLGSISDFVWGGIIVKGIEAAVAAIGKAIGAVGDFFNSSIQSALESQDVMANVEATVRSTGGAAGYTAQEIADMATELQGVTKFSDETIMRGQAMLLTFTQIGHDVFPLATEAMLNLAQKMGSDLNGAAIQLGKALNDPVNGVTALRRVGVMLTDDMKAQIETMVEQGDVMGAQKIILGELETEFGGLARAMGETASGQMAILTNKIDNFKELIGGPLLLVMSQFKVNLLDTFMQTDAFKYIESFLTILNQLLQDGTPLWYALGATFRQFDDVVPIFEDIGIAFMKFQNALDTGMPTLQALQVVALDIAKSDGPLAGIAQFIWDIINAYRQGGLSEVLSELGTKLKDALMGADMATPLQGMVDRIADFLQTVDWGRVASVIASVISSALEIAGKGLDAIVMEIDWSPLGRAAYGAVDEFMKGFGTALSDALKNTDVPAIFTQEISASDLGRVLLGLIFPPSLAFSFRDELKKLGVGMWEGLADGLNSVEVGITDWFRDHIVDPVKRFLGIASPSTLFFGIGMDIINGLVNGFKSLSDTFVDSFTGMLNTILNLPGFKQVAEFLGVDLSTTNTTGNVGLDVGLPGTTGGRNMTGIATSPTGTTTTAAGGSGNVYNFYGPVYVGTYEDLMNGAYNCPSPNPIVAATKGNLTLPSTAA